MRILDRVVQPFVLAVFKAQTHIFVCCRVALSFVGDQNPRRDATFVEQLAHQLLGGIPVTSALHQHVQHDTQQIRGSPQPILLAIDDDGRFVQMPFVAKARRSRPNSPSRLLSKL